MRPEFAQSHHQLEQAFHVERREALCRLVQHEDARARHQGATDGAHLLLAATERPRHLVAPLGEYGQQLQYALQRFAPTLARSWEICAQFQVLDHGHERKQPPALGDQHQRPPHPVVSRQVIDALAVKPDLATRAGLDADDAQQRAALAGAVGADKADDFALVHLEVDRVQDLRAIIECIQIMNAQHISRPNISVAKQETAGIRNSPKIPDNMADGTYSVWAYMCTCMQDCVVLMLPTERELCYPSLPLGIEEMRFTKQTIEALRLPAAKSEHIVWDDSLPGFGVRVRATSKAWRIQYRVGRLQRSESLGDIRKVVLEDARRIARQRFAMVELGRDPSAERESIRRAQAAAELTLGTTIGRYLAAKQEILRPSTYKVTRIYLERWKPLHGTPINAVKRAQVAALLSEMAGKHGRMSAQCARRRLSAVYSWAMREGLADANPVIGSNDPGSGARSRDRVLGNDEIRILWNVCCAMDDDFSRIVRLLLITACRRDEIGGLRWSEIDMNTGTLTLPGSRTKNHRQHSLVLPKIAHAILHYQSRTEGRDFVFGKRGLGFSGWSFAKLALDKRILETADKPLASWTIHDIRRSTATGLANLGVQPHVIEAILNHWSGHRGGVAGVYNRASYEAEKQVALEAWAEHITTLIA